MAKHGKTSSRNSKGHSGHGSSPAQATVRTISGKTINRRRVVASSHSMNAKSAGVKAASTSYNAPGVAVSQVLVKPRNTKTGRTVHRSASTGCITRKSARNAVQSLARDIESKGKNRG